jgi:lipoprotein-releasing system permease protein
LKASWFIALRMFRTKRRSALLSFISTIAITGVCLGTAALIIALSVLDGFERDIKDKVISFTSHIHLTGYSNKPLEAPARTVSLLSDTIGGITSIVPYAAREGMIRFGDDVEGIYLKGIDTVYDDARLRDRLTDGRYFVPGPGGEAPLIVGKSLALKLGVAVGDTAFVFALAADGSSPFSPRAKKFVVIGIFESGMAEYDEVFAFTILDAAADLFGLGERITGYDIMVGNTDEIDEIAAGIEEVLGYPHSARSVYSVYRNLFSWAELQKKLSPILLTLTARKFNGSREIGVLRSVGASVSLIRTIFLYQGIFIGATGVLFGNLLAFMLCWIQLEFSVLSLPADIYYMNTVPISLDPLNFLAVSILTLFLSYLTTIIPAHAAGRLDPVRIFRFG